MRAKAEPDMVRLVLRRDVWRLASTTQATWALIRNDVLRMVGKQAGDWMEIVATAAGVLVRKAAAALSASTELAIEP